MLSRFEKERYKTVVCVKCFVQGNGRVRQARHGFFGVSWDLFWDVCLVLRPVVSGGGQVSGSVGAWAG
jgi:hypothetical protein